MKIIIIILFLGVLIALFTGLKFMLKGDQRLKKALALRVGLSLSLIVVLGLAYVFKSMQPHGVVIHSSLPKQNQNINKP